MTPNLYLTKRRNGHYCIGFFEGNHRKWAGDEEGKC